MENLNRIELRGNVGTVRYGSVGDSNVANFTMATSILCKGYNSEGRVETMWHNVTAWEGKNIVDLKKIVKGAPVYVCGRLREKRYNTSEGEERVSVEVLAYRVSLVDEEPMTSQIY